MLIMKLVILIFILCNILSIQAKANDSNDIKTAVTIQNAGNVTANTWTTELLGYQAKYLTETAEKATKQAFVEHGGNAADLVTSSTYESNFVFNNGEKFGIIKSRLVMSQSSLNLVGIMNTIRISAIRGGDVISVSCLREGKEVLVIDGQCDEAIRKNLGISFLVTSNVAVPNREITAIAAVTNNFAKTMLFVIGGILLSILTIWILSKPKNNPTSKAYREGYLAFQNALDENANPYLEKDENLSKSWLDGHRNALKIRNKKES